MSPRSFSKIFRYVFFGIIVCMLTVTMYRCQKLYMHRRVSSHSLDTDYSGHRLVSRVEGNDHDMCNVTCVTGQPCEYRDEVDFRVIVLTYNRPKSLAQCLEKLDSLVLGNASLVVDIWIDRSKSGQVDQDTLTTSRRFATEFRKGNVCIHVQQRNAYITGQWIDTWRPKPDTTEIALILEDDVDVSPFVYIWLRAVKHQYAHVPDVSGYTLQSEDLMFFGGSVKKMVIPKTEVVFAYRVMGTWGYAPHPQKWRQFQDWYHDVRPKGLVKPYIPNFKPTQWFKEFENRNYEESMWSMWHQYYDYINNYFTIYNNLMNFVKTNTRLLSTNRREKGLHFSSNAVTKRATFLLNEWSSEFVDLPDVNNIKKYDYDGQIYNGTISQWRAMGK